MMEKILLLLGFLLLVQKVGGQNLVLNPSLEEYLECPYDWNEPIGSLHCAKYWSSGGKSPDYYHKCTNFSTFHPNGVPSNSVGYQVPRTGSAYAGIFVHNPYEPFDYREYMQGSLAEPLKKDTVYRAAFYVSRAEKDGVAIGRLGMLFSIDTIIGVPENPAGLVSSSVINKTPHIENPKERIITDTANWVLICGYFKASGGERYFTIGNYYGRDSTPYILMPLTDRLSYYYVDDVSVEKASVSPFEWLSDSRVCSPDSILRYELPGFLTDVRWSTGDTTHTTHLHGPGIYWVRASWDGCYFTDTVRIEYTPAPAFVFPEDTASICASSLPLSIQITDCCAEKIIWSTGDTTSSTFIHSEGLVWV